MSELFTLFSSSAGNCTCLSSGGTTLLVDAGGSCKKILTALGEHCISPADLSGIVLTHEHSDHISALRVLLKRVPVPLFARPATLGYLAENSLVPPGTRLVPAEPGGVIGDIAFETFPTLHDGQDSCGYTFTLPDGKRIGFATDLGRFTQVVYDHLRGCDLAVLESNYDPGMLAVSGYPYPLIRRIRSEHGHLSNEDCAGAAVQLVKSGVKRLLLAHTSKHNNLEELAYRTTLCALQENGVNEGEVELVVAPKFACSCVVVA